MAAHKEYRQKWVDAGYDHRMGSAWVCTPPDADHIRLYHFTSAEHALSNIEHTRLKVARFSDCNDPFELIALNFRAARHRRTGRNFKQESDANIGFLSFSRNWIEPLMWSHYANRHKGVCLGFDLPRTDVTEIHYNDERLLDELDKLDADPTKLPPDLKDLLLRTKARPWAYELELRRYVQLGDMNQDGPLYFCPFNARLVLREVVVGDRCTLDVDAVRGFVRMHQPAAVVCHARLAFGSFNVVPDERTIP